MNSYHFSTNAIESVRNLFFKELSAIYSKDELSILFVRVVESLGYEFNSVRYFNQSELIQLSGIIDELKEGKPLQYILGYAYFYNLKFLVNPNVLIPRPETEELVWNVKNYIDKNFLDKKTFRIADIGTGSGCIAIVLKHLFPQAEVWAIDISEEAMEAAKRNAQLNGVEIFFEIKDILKDSLNGAFDVIVSNPPYIPISDSNTVADRVKKYEPSVALFCKSATEFYERILVECTQHLNLQGFAFLELNQFYSHLVRGVCEKLRLQLKCKIIKDWSGNDRFLLVEKN